jgi:hypothetical protein
MTLHAGRIVHGRVLEVRDGVHPQQGHLAVTFVKVQVLEMLKGNAGREMTFMQYGNSRHQYVAHMPRYSVGEEVVLFLHPESKLGFTSPVAQGQGKFVVHHDTRSGQQVLRNEHMNHALFARLNVGKVISHLTLNKAEREIVGLPDQQASTGIAVQPFCSLVRKFAAQPRADWQ